MDITFKRFVVGTKERPTVFLTQSGEVSECPEDAHMFESIKKAEEEITHCDEPEIFKLYDVDVSINGV